MITSVITRSIELGIGDEQPLGVVAVRGFDHAIAGVVENPFRQLAHAGLVLNEQHGFRRRLNGAVAAVAAACRRCR